MDKSSEFKQAYRDPLELNNQESIADCVQDILNVAKLRLKMELSQIDLLDVGCGTGDYAFCFESHVASITAVEPEERAVKIAEKRRSAIKSDIRFCHGFIEDMDLDQRFDLAISLTTVEHMPEARKSFEKIIAMLKPGGMIYLTAPNKLWPMECHYHLPFLSWLPIRFANVYLRAAGKGRSYQDCSYMRTYWGMKRLFQDLDCSVSFITPNLNSRYIGAGDSSTVRTMFRRLGVRLLQRFPIFWVISKGFFMVIQRNDALKLN